MMPTCIDLGARFGTRFRVRREADGATWYATPEAERTWLLEIRCRYGFVYPQGGEILAAAITSRRIGRQVAALPGILSSRGDVERVLTFPMDDAEAVLALLKPYRRRHLSPEQRAQSVARLARLRQERRKAQAQSDETGVRIDAAAGNDQTAVPEAVSAAPTRDGDSNAVPESTP
jgi:hypothetical protein